MTRTFEERLLELRLEHRRDFLELLNGFEPDGTDAFAGVLRDCASVGITPRKLAAWASVSYQTIRRWTEGKSAASKYDQLGLIEDIKEELDRQIKELDTALDSNQAA